MPAEERIVAPLSLICQSPIIRSGLDDANAGNWRSRIRRVSCSIGRFVRFELEGRHALLEVRS